MFEPLSIPARSVGSGGLGSTDVTETECWRRIIHKLVLSVHNDDTKNNDGRTPGYNVVTVEKI